MDNSYQVKSSILFVIFNRPDTTWQVFEEISKVKPKKLYIAADGPRTGNVNDKMRCEESRAVIDKIDWDCDVRTLFRKENLGCGLAVSQAISWFFDEEPEGIILEDDCLPNQHFFRFCDEMLNTYRNDGRIGHISGTNVHDFIKRGSASFYFSRLTAIWGWATWRRVWSEYDYEMKSYPQIEKSGFLKSITDKSYLQYFLKRDFDTVFASKNHTWDFQYSFMQIISNRLSVIPNYNLISNIGFNSNATHTSEMSQEYANVSKSEMPYPISYPINLLPDVDADNFSLGRVYPKKNKYYLLKTINLIKKIINV